MSISRDMMNIALTESFYNPITLLEFNSDIKKSQSAEEYWRHQTNNHKSGKRASELAHKHKSGEYDSPVLSKDDQVAKHSRNTTMILTDKHIQEDREKDRSEKQKAAGVSGNSNDRKRERKQNG